MQDVPILLPHGEPFRMVSRARLDGTRVYGELDFPPREFLGFDGHFPGKPYLPGVMTMSGELQIIIAYFEQYGQGKYPFLTEISFARFHNRIEPGPVEFSCNIHHDDTGGVAICLVEAKGKERVVAVVAFDLKKDDPRKALLPLPIETNLDQVNSFKGVASGRYGYKGNEQIRLADLEEIPWPLMIEAMGQAAIQYSQGDPSLAKALFPITYIRKARLYGIVAPKGTLKLECQVYCQEKRGIAHCAAIAGRYLVATVEIGFGILGRKRS